MGGCVFKLNRDATAVLKPEIRQLCQWLSKVDDDTFLYIVLSEDHQYGPYHTKPPIERDTLARVHVWGKNVPNIDKIPNIDRAREEYRSLIFDVQQYKRDSFATKLMELHSEFAKTPGTEFTKIQNIIKSIDTLEDRMKALDLAIDRQEEVVELAGDREMTLIERVIRNRKQYKDMAFREE